MDNTDFLIIGAGAIGLAVAADISVRFKDASAILLERHDRFGRETSSRNSEVIHAGIYYPQGSLKARLCVEGNRLLYDFCKKWQVPHARTGKLIVAQSDEEVATLAGLLRTGRENGVEGLCLLDASQVAQLEPNINCIAAVLSPSTGIVDSHQLMARLEAIALQQGAICAYQHEAVKIEAGENAHTVIYRGPTGAQGAVQARWLINSAGLASDFIAGLMGIDIDRAEYRLHPCKGEYFSISSSRAKLVSRLIYPPPYRDLRGLGIHVTKSLDGMVKLGPNAFYVDKIDYGVDPGHAAEFYEGIRDYLPFLKPEDLQPDTSGIRPKLQAPGTPARDFVICHEKERGLAGIINLIGIESPGLTSSLSIARMVGDMIEEEESL